MFEQLDKSLKDFLDERKWQRVPLSDVRPVLLQVGAALLQIFTDVRHLKGQLISNITDGQSPGLPQGAEVHALRHQARERDVGEPPERTFQSQTD